MKFKKIHIILLHQRNKIIKNKKIKQLLYIPDWHINQKIITINNKINSKIFKQITHFLIIKEQKNILKIVIKLISSHFLKNKLKYQNNQLLNRELNKQIEEQMYQGHCLIDKLSCIYVNMF